MAKVLMSHLVKLFAWMEVARGSQYKFSDNIDVAFVFSINTELFIWQLLLKLSDLKKWQVRGTYYVKVDKLGHGAHWRRTYGQQVYSPYLLAFTHEIYGFYYVYMMLLCGSAGNHSCYYRMRQVGNPIMLPKKARWMRITVFLIMLQLLPCRYHNALHSLLTRR